MLLSLVSGGMRAITGLIGRRSPSQVSYRAATATIGIRGTDTTIATMDGVVAVTVSDGSVTFTFNGQTLTIAAGEAVFARPGQAPVRGTVADVLRQVPPAIQQAFAQFQAMNSVVLSSGPGQPRLGQQGDEGVPQGQSGVQGGAQGGSGAGGGGSRASGS